MALRAGRVGINPDQVDSQGRLIVGSGSETYAFITAKIIGAGEVTATDGETTITKSGENKVVIPIPNSGVWEISHGLAKIPINVTEYGSSLVADFDPVTIVQANIGNQTPNISFDGTTFTYSYIRLEGISAPGIVFNTKGKDFTLEYIGGTQQHGQCTKTATLPSIITTGTGRINFNTTTPKSYTYNAQYNNFIARESGANVGSTLTVKIKFS